MAGLKVIVTLFAVVGLTLGQLTFPGESDSPSTSPQAASPATRPASDAPTADAPASNEGNTRFFLPGLPGLPGVPNIFDECNRCSHNDLSTANRCCQRGNRGCCAFLAPVGPPPGAFGPGFGQGFGQGGFPGGFQQPGGFQGGFPGGFQGPVPGQVGPPGFGGAKPGTCPFVNVQSGFSRFANSASCVAECRSDFECHGAKKCCSVGCSSICRDPPGFGPSSPVIVPTTKPGFCPRPLGPLETLGSLLGLRSGAGGAAAGAVGSTRALGDVPEGAAEASPETAEERAARRKEQRKLERGEREKRSPQRPGSDDQRERRLNRLARTRGRVTRQANEPDQRFFLPNIFCKDECFNDFDCLGNLKCCSKGKDECRSCVGPSFF